MKEMRKQIIQMANDPCKQIYKKINQLIFRSITNVIKHKNTFNRLNEIYNPMQIEIGTKQNENNNSSNENSSK